MKKSYKPVVLEVIRKNGDKRYVAVVDTIEKRSFLFWYWFDVINRDFYVIHNDGPRFWVIRRLDEIVPRESIFYDSFIVAEHVAKTEVLLRNEAEFINDEMSIISVKPVN